MQSKASAVWKGGLKDGTGTYSASSGAFSDVGYNFGQRFEGKAGSNPEELVAAAHASCFAMALSGQLGSRGMTAESLEVTATVTIEKQDIGFTVTESHLDLVARIPNADQAKFDEATANAKEGCPISRLLKTKVSLSARLA